MPSHLLLATTLFPDGEWKHEVGREGRKGDEGLKAVPEKVSGWKYVFTLLDSIYTLSPTFPSRIRSSWGKSSTCQRRLGFHWFCKLSACRLSSL